jgi:hypothetical protein
MRLLGSAPKSHLCDQRRRSKVTGLSDLMTLFIDLGCLYCKQTQRAFNVFKNTQNWLKIDSVDQKFNWLECGNFSQDAGTSGTERVIAFSQLAVKGLINTLPSFCRPAMTAYGSLDPINKKSSPSCKSHNSSSFTTAHLAYTWLNKICIPIVLYCIVLYCIVLYCIPCISTLAKRCHPVSHN